MKALIGCGLAVFLMSAVFAQQAPTAVKQETATWRTVGTAAGAGGSDCRGRGRGSSRVFRRSGHRQTQCDRLEA